MRLLSVSIGMACHAVAKMYIIFSIAEHSHSFVVYSHRWPPSTSFIFRLYKRAHTYGLLLKIAAVVIVVVASRWLFQLLLLLLLPMVCTQFSTFIRIRIRIWHLTFGIYMLCVPSRSSLRCSLP